MGELFTTLLAAAALWSGQHQHHPPTPPAKTTSQPAKSQPAKPAQRRHEPAKKPAAPAHQQHGPPARQHEGHEGMGMHRGVLGPWPMNREGSGTSWMPDNSPMYMKMLPSSGGWELGLMGFVSVNYADAGGRRGDEQFFSNSMLMLHASRDSGKCRLGLRAMASLDPFNGRRGYPNLFQTGETAGGQPLKDRQHPHDLLSELSLTYSQPLGGGWGGLVYFAPIGEPALAGSSFPHRPSAMEIGEAPISHHWFDSTHITYGVATLGLTKDDKWKLDASAFKGREPDEDRFDIDPIRLDSYSGRLTYNPSKELSIQASYAYLKEPEWTEPGIDQHRITASASIVRPMGGGHLASTAFWGRNIKHDGPETNAFGLEASWLKDEGTLYFRWEQVEKDELVDVPEGVYRIDKFTFGGIKNLWSSGGYETGIGAFVDFYRFPASLEPFYGRSPVSFGVYLRVRPARLKP